MHDAHSRITVLGAGPAGLAAAYYAARLRVPCTVYERSSLVGGAAATITHGGFQFDVGAHRFHDKDPEITADVQALLEGRLQRVSAPSRVYSRGRMFRFPLEPVDLARGLGAAGLTRAVADLAAARSRPASGEADFEAFACRRYGRPVAGRFLLNYSEKLWGRPASRLSPDVAGGRVAGLGLRSVLARAVFGGVKRAPHLDGAFYYPTDGGIGRISERLAETVGRGRIRMESEVERIRHDAGLVRALVVNGQEVAAGRAVVSSIPLPSLVTRLWPPPPPDVMEAARAMSFRSLIVVALFLARPGITADATVYFPDPEFPFTRVSEPRNRNPRMAPAGRTSLVAEIPCAAGDADYRRDDAELASRVIGPLVTLGWIAPGDVSGHLVHRVDAAYPILEVGTRHHVDVVMRYLQGLRNLICAGRNGTFTYSHIHDQMRAGREAVKAMSQSAA
jgi:protoporphyrinogen oxidase